MSENFRGLTPDPVVSLPELHDGKGGRPQTVVADFDNIRTLDQRRCSARNTQISFNRARCLDYSNYPNYPNEQEVVTLLCSKKPASDSLTTSDVLLWPRLFHNDKSLVPRVVFHHGVHDTGNLTFEHGAFLT